MSRFWQLRRLRDLAWTRVQWIKFRINSNLKFQSENPMRYSKRSKIQFGQNPLKFLTRKSFDFWRIFSRKCRRCYHRIKPLYLPIIISKILETTLAHRSSLSSNRSPKSTHQLRRNNSPLNQTLLPLRFTIQKQSSSRECQYSSRVYFQIKNAQNGDCVGFLMIRSKQLTKQYKSKNNQINKFKSKIEKCQTNISFFFIA